MKAYCTQNTDRECKEGDCCLKQSSDDRLDKIYSLMELYFITFRNHAVEWVKNGCKDE